MRDPMVRRGMFALGTLGAALSLACAGKDTPEVDADLRSGIANAYSGSPVAAAGASGRGGAGSAGGGAGGVASGSGGSAGSAAGGSANAAAEGGGGGMPATNGGSTSGAAGAGMSSAGAAGAGSQSGPPCDGFAVLEASCSSGGCHGAGSNLGNFAESESIARTFIGQEGAVCAGRGSIIDTDDPSASVLLLKLSDDPPCGQPMPLGGTLDEADVACLEDWIGSL